MTIEFYLAFIFTAFLVIASPGPTSFLVLAHMGTNRRFLPSLLPASCVARLCQFVD